MPIQVICSQCSAKLAVPDRYAGQQLKCSKCSTSFQVPVAAVIAPAPTKASRGSTVVKVVAGVTMGFFSGFLIYMAAAMLFALKEPSAFFVWVTFGGGWALSVWLLIRRTQTVSKVLSRGFLLGAAEWLAMIPVGMILSGKALTETTTLAGSSEAALVGATVGAGLISFITGGVSVVMALVCLVGFAVTYFLAREMKPETEASTHRCPECAELIQSAARKCKHCGASIVVNVPSKTLA